MSKRLFVLGTAALVMILVFSSGFPVHQTLIRQAAAQGTVLPYTIATYGNAWNGVIAFGLNGPTTSYLVVMNTNGTLLDLRTSSTGNYAAVKNIAQDTLMFQGEPQVGGSSTSPTYATHFWNVVSNTTQDFPNVVGTHDVEYDPINNTFLTLQQYVQPVGNNLYLIDKIMQLDPNGTVIWSWNPYNYIPLSEASIFNETSTLNGQTVIDFSHGNTLDWDYNNSVIYLNLRNTNTFYKINQNTGNIIWACGEFGNFTLLDQNGNVVPALWYHGHDPYEVAPDVFAMFNNDFYNVTNPNDHNSQMIEFTLNEQNMTARLDWSWTAPEQYYAQTLGATVLLPNGDWMSDFGTLTHQFPENQLPDGTWDFTDTGATLIEVNPAGQMMRTITFPTGYWIYRIGLVTNLSQNAFSSSPSTTSTPTPTSTSTPTPTTTPTPTPTSSSAPSLTPTPAPTPTPSSKQSVTPAPSSNLTIVAGVSLLAIATVIVVLAVPAYFERKKTQNCERQSLDLVASKQVYCVPTRTT